MTTTDNTPPIIVLGLAEHAARRSLGWDLLGLRSVVIFPTFPSHLKGLHLVLAVRRAAVLAGDLTYRVVMRDESSPSNWARVEHTLKFEVPGQATKVEVPKFQEAPKEAEVGFQYPVITEVQSPGPNSYEINVIAAPPLKVYGPTSVETTLEIAGHSYPQVPILVAFQAPAPLSDTERLAIRSRPGAPGKVASYSKCKKCGDEHSFYRLLEPNLKYPAQPNETNLDNAADIWRCSCGNLELDLRYMKAGLHDLFRRQLPATGKAKEIQSYLPLFEEQRIDQILAEYDALIQSSPREQAVQAFLEDHSIFWSFLSPVQILHKPKVLTKKVADFGVLTSHGILYLIEIEKPQTRILKLKGGLHSEIQRGVDQIRDWQSVVTQHRKTLLSELNLESKRVDDIRYILVGGLTRACDPTGLAQIRRSALAPTTDFYCFDELSAFATAVRARLQGV